MIARIEQNKKKRHQFGAKMQHFRCEQHIFVAILMYNWYVFTHIYFSH